MPDFSEPTRTTDSMPEAESRELCCNSKGGAHCSAICNRGCAHSTSDTAHEAGALLQANLTRLSRGEDSVEARRIVNPLGMRVRQAALDATQKRRRRWSSVSLERFYHHQYGDGEDESAHRVGDSLNAAKHDVAVHLRCDT
jgi:hypothetical protein